MPKEAYHSFTVECELHEDGEWNISVSGESSAMSFSLGSSNLQLGLIEMAATVYEEIEREEY